MRWLWWLVPGGSVVLLALWLRRLEAERHEAERADLLPRWAAFIRSDPQIPPARVPPVQPLIATKVDRFARFRQRTGTR